MKRYIITSAVPGCEPHLNFLKAIQNYKEKNKATVIIIPTPKLYKKDEIASMLYKQGEVLEDELELNGNIRISMLPINPEQSDPVSGLDRLYGNETSVIYGSPIQRLKSIASPSDSLPRVLMTPGACTKPYKRNTKKTIIATKDHVVGALIVEVESNKYYHFRQVQADRDGSFIDLGVQYKSDGKTIKAKVAGLNPGDWHTGYTDPQVRKCTIEMLELFKPDYLFMNDFFDGISVNHHIEHKLLLRAMLGAQNNLSSELQLNAVELSSLQKYVKKSIVVVKSNHDEFLDKWLDEGKYVDDKLNHIIGLELALAKANGKDPLEYGINKYQKLEKVKFLRSDESFKISRKNIECGMHGHLGPNGSRGNATSIERSYTFANMGHTHSPEIQRNTWVAGTSSYLRLNYNKGPSSWMQSHIVTYENGSRQLINIINGKWKA